MAEKPLLHFISAGPGDPELITLKGIKALESCPHVLAPDQLAASFAAFLSGKEVESPFVHDRRSLVAWIAERLEKAPVAILVPGDFSVFCPFQSFVADFEGRYVVIPGVSTHVAAMAMLGKSLDVPGVAHASVITSPKAYARDGRASFMEIAGRGRTLVLYMNDRPLADLARELMDAYPPSTPIALFEEIGGENEAVTVSTLKEIAGEVSGRDPFAEASESPAPTLALVVVGDAVATDEASHWWDHRYEKIWKPRGMR